MSKELSDPKTPKYERVIILSDSKGNYLRTESDIIKHINIEIVWWTTKGRKTKQGIKYLTENIASLRDGKKTVILFRDFTCDVSKKVDKLIYPNYTDSTDLIDNIKPYLDILKEIHSLERDIDIGILKINKPRY